jgi:hypothetical protein
MAGYFGNDFSKYQTEESEARALNLSYKAMRVYRKFISY